MVIQESDEDSEKVVGEAEVQEMEHSATLKASISHNLAPAESKQDIIVSANESSVVSST